MRSHLGWQSDYVMCLTNAQHRACESLNNVLHGSNVGGKETNGLDDEQDWYSCLEVADENVLEEADDDEYENGECYHADEPALTVRRHIADTATQAAILDLLVALFTQLPTGEEDKFYSPIIRFTVLASMRQSGRWLSPRQITHLLAVLLFCGREVLMALMHQRLLDDPTIRYSKCVLHDPKTTSVSLNLHLSAPLRILPASWMTIGKVQSPRCTSL
jgi:hypothetical protein